MTLKSSHIRPMTEGDLDSVLALERESDLAPHWSQLIISLRFRKIAARPYGGWRW